MASNPEAQPSGADLEEVAAECHKRYGDNMSVYVGVDGSTMSDKAMSTALSFTNRARGDKLTVMHISDSQKDYLPKHLLPSNLRKHYENMALQARMPAQWQCREKSDGESTCTSLTRAADKAGADILVLGSFGRKGEKLDVLGTVSDFTLRTAHASVCIVRPSGGARMASQLPIKYLFATDGSHAAALAFCVLVQLLRRPQDQVVVVMACASDGEKEQAVINHYQKFMTAHKVQGQAYVKVVDRGSSTTPQTVIDAATDERADVLVLGISGYGRKKLGSVSEQISVRAHCTTIIIKDSKEVLANRFYGSATLSAEYLPRGSSFTAAPSGRGPSFTAGKA